MRRPLVKTHRGVARGSSCIVVGVVLAGVLGGGCPQTPGGNGAEDGATDGVAEMTSAVFNNTKDPTNDGASYIGAAACAACHADFAALTRIHAHTQALKPIADHAPAYPQEGTRSGVPDPPAGKTWSDVSYVISGYLHGANFVDLTGFVMTDGVEGVKTRWALDFPPNGTTAGFVPYLPAQATPKPFAFDDCFRCHTTGPQPQDPNNPMSQDNRPGILGTWEEVGVRCEACHGPGSKHAPNPQRRDLFVDPTAATCGRCHTQGDDPNVIVVADGFMNGNTQYPQLLASGGHREFSCSVCHEPHASITYDRENGLRNACTDCHVDQNLAFHSDATFRLGDYEEVVTCESCHMPLAAKSTSTAPASLVGGVARIADVRAHIFRINTDDPNAAAFITVDGQAVQKDAQGRAAVTVDYVCLRCHHVGGNVFPLQVDGALRAAKQMHAKAAGAE